MDGLPERADAVVVGAGPAGAAVARRLADAGRHVVVLEAGPGRPRPPALAGLDLVAAAEQSDRFWPGLQVRDRPDGPRRAFRQARSLGGGSMINGMLLTPGDRLDYRNWEEGWGCTGWGPDQMEPWLRRALADYPARRGQAGPVSAAVARAAGDDGLPVGGTSLDPDRLGVLTAELAAIGERRWSAADAHLDGDGAVGAVGVGRAAIGGPQVRRLVGGALTVVTEAPVARLMPGSGGVGGAAVLTDGQRVAAPLVVACAGALATPALLWRSGLDDRPVGRGLRDHPSYAFTLMLRDRVARSAELARCPPVVSTLIRWSSDPAWPGDLQAIVIDRVEPPGWTGPPLAVVVVGLMAVTSVGSITRSPDPDPGPDVDSGQVPATGPEGIEVVTGALGTVVDRRRLRAGVRTVARWLGSDAVAEVAAEVHIDDRGTPLDRLATLTEVEIDQLIASRPGPYTHPSSTCRMGSDGDPAAVTSCEPARAGELIGHPGIRLADASIHPDLIRGGPQLPIVAVATRIADDIVATG